MTTTGIPGIAQCPLGRLDPVCVSCNNGPSGGESLALRRRAQPPYCPEMLLEGLLREKWLRLAQGKRRRSSS